MSKRRFIQAVCGVVLLALVAFVIYVNVDNLEGAYGSGPPFYSRTEHMNVWVNPLPILGGVDLVVLLLVAAYVRWVRKR